MVTEEGMLNACSNIDVMKFVTLQCKVLKPHQREKLSQVDQMLREAFQLQLAAPMLHFETATDFLQDCVAVKH